MFNEGAFDRESAEYLARLAYKKLREKNPDNPLLGFARVMERGFWLWKKEELEVIPELADEFRERYKPRHGAYPLPFESYYRDIKRELGEEVGDLW